MHACFTCGAPVERHYQRYCMDCYAARQGWREPRSTAPDAYNRAPHECAPYSVVKAGAEHHWALGFAEGYRVGLHDRRYSEDRA